MLLLVSAIIANPIVNVLAVDVLALPAVVVCVAAGINSTIDVVLAVVVTVLAVVCCCSRNFCP